MVSVSTAAGDALAILQPFLQPYLVVQLVLFASLLLVSLLPLKHNRETSPAQLALFSILTFAVMALFRWPYLALMELNPDESQDIASALTLLVDPVFWRSVDTGTHGPMVVYPLLVPRLLGMAVDYGSSKLIGILMMYASVICTYFYVRKSVSEQLSMILMLPFTAFVCLTDFGDFLAYNGEHAVILLAALALCSCVSAAAAGSGREQKRRFFLLGVSVGLIPYAKLQGIVVALTMFAYGAWLIVDSRADKITKRKCFVHYFLGLFLFTGIVCAATAYFKVFDDFVTRFLLGQYAYANAAGGGLFEKTSIFWRSLCEANRFGGNFFLGMVVVSVGAAVYSVAHWRQQEGAGPAMAPARWRKGIFLVLLLAASIYSVYASGKGYHHYYLLLVVPLVLVAGMLFAVAYSRCTTGTAKTAAVFLFLLAGTGSQFISKPFIFDTSRIKSILSHRTILESDPVLHALSRVADKRDKMVIWGWGDRYHVATGLVKGARTGTSGIVENDFGHRGYYLKSFVSEVERNDPQLFVDLVAPGQYAYQDRSMYGFELYPPVAELVKRRFVLVEEVGGVRIFVRRDKAETSSQKPQV